MLVGWSSRRGDLSASERAESEHLAVRRSVAATTNASVRTVVGVRTGQVRTESVAVGAVVAVQRHARRWSWTSGDGWVATKHSYARAIL